MCLLHFIILQLNADMSIPYSKCLWIELLIDLSFYANFPAHIIWIISQYPRRGSGGISSNQWEVSCCRVSEYNRALWPLKSGVSRDLEIQCKQGQKDLLDTEFLNFRYCLNVTIFKYLIPINQLPDLGYW